MVAAESPGLPCAVDAAVTLISQANGNLKARKSGISIVPGKGAMTVDAPDGSGSKTLAHVDVKFDADPTAAKFYSDCRQAAREVMGPTSADKDEQSKKMEKAVGWPGGTPLEIPPNEGPLDLVALLLYIDQRIRETPGYETMSDEEKRAVAAKAFDHFPWLDDEDKAKLKHMKIGRKKAEELGMDQFAQPGVGEAFTTISGDKPQMGGYFFHYATVIMVAGPDRVTLENAGGVKDQLTDHWAMQTYGPASKDQTFHDEWAKHLGKDTHTLRVRTEPTPPNDADKFSGMFAGQLLERYRKSTSDDEKFYLKQELDKRSFYADVIVEATESTVGSDSVYLLFSAGFGSISTGTFDLENGTGHIFRIPLARLWPVADPLIVKVLEFNLVLSDTLIGLIVWPSPYWPKQDVALSTGSARYRVMLTT